MVGTQPVRQLKHDAQSVSKASHEATEVIHFKKLDGDEQIVFGEVYAPGFPDSQGDVMSREEIRKMAYNFLRKGQVSNIDTNHSRQPNQSYVVESFIARDDDPVFIPGSWVLGVKVPDPIVWQMIKSGELNGFSLDGVGVRVPIELEIEMPEILKGETEKVGNHQHVFSVKFDEAGTFLGGKTGPGPDGHVHKIMHGTVTESALGHTHRFSFVEGVLNVHT